MSSPSNSHLSEENIEILENYDVDNENFSINRLKETLFNDEISSNIEESYLIKSSEDIEKSENFTLIEQDLSELTNILSQNNDNLYKICLKIKDIPAFIQDTHEGLSFLDVKSNLYFTYIQFLLVYMLFKSQGKSIHNHEIVRKLIYLKSLLLKLKPIEKKLDYQISKVLRQAPTKKNDGQVKEMLEYKAEKREEDPLKFKPRPDKLNKERTTENLDIDESGEVIEKKKDERYKPLKISAVLSKEDKVTERRKKQLERRKKFMLRTSFISDLEGEFTGKPTESHYGNNDIFDKEERERIDFEETHFVRLPIKKKDKIRLKKKMRQGNEEKIDDFREMENIREVLKMDGVIEDDGEQRIERKKKLQKTMAGFGFGKKKGIKKIYKKK